MYLFGQNLPLILVTLIYQAQYSSTERTASRSKVKLENRDSKLETSHKVGSLKKNTTRQLAPPKEKDSDVKYVFHESNSAKRPSSILSTQEVGSDGNERVTVEPRNDHASLISITKDKHQQLFSDHSEISDTVNGDGSNYKDSDDDENILCKSELEDTSEHEAETSSHYFEGSHSNDNSPHTNGNGFYYSSLDEEVGERCGPCECFPDDRENGVKAKCSNRRLKRFPLTLPNNTVSIDLSTNLLNRLNMTSLVFYTYLQKVVFFNNSKLVKVYKSLSKTKSSSIQYLTVSYCNIKDIEDESFAALPQLRQLTLQKNLLKNLTKNLFKGLSHLRTLDLSSNLVSFIEVGTFDHLVELERLDLSKNKRLGYSERKFSPALFRNMTQLQVLFIQRNSLSRDKKTKYPDTTLQKLVGLQELTIDGLYRTELGPEMRTLKNLTHLSIQGCCWIVNISESFFDNVPYLRYFSISGCANLIKVHQNAYTKLQHLESLAIKTMKYYEIDTAFDDLVGLNNSNLKNLTLSHLSQPKYQCQFLGYRHGQHLQHLPLERLDLSRNRINLLGLDFLNLLPTTLDTFILKQNLFIAATQSMNQLAVMSGVRILDLSLQQYDKQYSLREPGASWYEGNYPVTSQGEPIEEFTGTEAEDYNEFSFEWAGDEQEGKKEKDQNDKIEENKQYYSVGSNVSDPPNLDSTHFSLSMKLGKRCLKIPPRLRVLYASNYDFFGMQILTHRLCKNYSSLSVVDFSNSFLSTWGSYLLPPDIKEVKLGYNYCSKISASFFHHNNSHRRIFLNNNMLGQSFAEDLSGIILGTLTQAELLDLSRNMIYKLPKLFFRGLHNVSRLILSDNKLTTLNTSFASMRALKFLDLSRNSIRWIEKETRDDLDDISILSAERLRVDLTENPLPCTCAGIDIMTWMATTKVIFHKQSSLKCMSDHMKEERLGDLEQRRVSLQRLCTSKSLFIAVCATVVSVVTVALGLSLLYRYRWKLRYLHNTAMAALFGYKPQIVAESGCTFDAFIVYTSETREFVLKTCLRELEEKRGHRLCVEDRDFLPGTYLVSNIVSAVRNSTRTVPVLTPNFYQDGLYSEYSFKMAVMEELFQGRSVLHLLLYDPVPPEQMSLDELMLFKRNSYTEFPPEDVSDENIHRNFWDAMSVAIGHVNRDVRGPPVLRILS